MPSMSEVAHLGSYLSVSSSRSTLQWRQMRVISQATARGASRSQRGNLAVQDQNEATPAMRIGDLRQMFCSLNWRALSLLVPRGSSSSRAQADPKL
jgi:hypothetical protein